MNWRLFTTINAIIALVTVSAVVIDLKRGQPGKPRQRRQQVTLESRPATTNRNQSDDRVEKVRIESVEDLTQARVDDLGTVPSVELTELMRRATPEQRAALALKFNEAPTDARTFGGMGVFFQAWAELDPKAALAGAFGMTDVGMRKLAAGTVVGSISPSASPELIRFLAEHPDPDLAAESKNDFVARLISNWSQLDPEAASKYFDEISDGSGGLGYNTREDIAFNWATLDPAAALEWVTQKGENPYLYDDAIRGWCRKDITAAAAHIAQHIDDAGAQQAASSVVTAMFDQNNIDGATAWVGALAKGDGRDRAETRFATLLAAKDPSSAARWLATLSANEQMNGVNAVANNWIQTNWPEASRWIESLSGDVRDEALSAAVSREGATRTDSLSLAMSISKEEARNSQVETVLRNWAAEDANAAESWVKGSSLSEEQRNHLRSIISETQQQSTEAQAEVERVIISH